MAPAITTSLRLPQELLDRADALIPLLGKHASAQASGSYVRSDILRLALIRGLESLETEHGGDKPSPPKPARKR
jgi:predicted DNA-binding protein